MRPVKSCPQLYDQEKPHVLAETSDSTLLNYANSGAQNNVNAPGRVKIKIVSSQIPEFSAKLHRSADHNLSKYVSAPEFVPVRNAILKPSIENKTDCNTESDLDTALSVYDTVFSTLKYSVRDQPVVSFPQPTKFIPLLSPSITGPAKKSIPMPAQPSVPLQKYQTAQTLVHFPPIFSELQKTSYSSIIIVDLNWSRCFEYELNRAYKEIGLIYPNAKDKLYIITYQLLYKDDGIRELVITTPERKYWHSIHPNTDPDAHFPNVFFLTVVDNELKRSNLLYNTKIVTCMPIGHYMYLQQLDHDAYADIVACYSFGHMINVCFDLCYVTDIRTFKRRSDKLIEQVAKIVINLIPKYNYLYHDDIEKQVNASFAKFHGTKQVLRDPRFEMITHLRLNPWLMTFEILPNDGKCIALINTEKCDNIADPNILYCSHHKCPNCEKNVSALPVVSAAPTPTPKLPTVTTPPKVSPKLQTLKTCRHVYRSGTGDSTADDAEKNK